MIALLLSIVGGGAGVTARVIAVALLSGNGIRGDRATAAVNLLGSFAAGALVAASLSAEWEALLVSGLLGGFTTLSSWISTLAAPELLPERRRSVTAWAITDLAAGLCAAAAGFALVA